MCSDCFTCANPVVELPLGSPTHKTHYWLFLYSWTTTMFYQIWNWWLKLAAPRDKWKKFMKKLWKLWNICHIQVFFNNIKNSASTFLMWHANHKINFPWHYWLKADNESRNLKEIKGTIHLAFKSFFVFGFYFQKEACSIPKDLSKLIFILCEMRLWITSGAEIANRTRASGVGNKLFYTKRTVFSPNFRRKK